jgi:hypothetical protein
LTSVKIAVADETGTLLSSWGVERELNGPVPSTVLQPSHCSSPPSSSSTCSIVADKWSESLVEDSEISRDTTANGNTLDSGVVGTFPICLPLFPASIMALRTGLATASGSIFIPATILFFSTMENAVSRWASSPSDGKRGCLWDRVNGPAVPLLRQICRVRDLEKTIRWWPGITTAD